MIVIINITAPRLPAYVQDPKPKAGVKVGSIYTVDGWVVSKIAVTVAKFSVCVQVANIWVTAASSVRTDKR